jgi:hypothetical protein
MLKRSLMPLSVHSERPDIVSTAVIAILHDYFEDFGVVGVPSGL